MYEILTSSIGKKATSTKVSGSSVARPTTTKSTTGGAKIISSGNKPHSVPSTGKISQSTIKQGVVGTTNHKSSPISVPVSSSIHPTALHHHNGVGAVNGAVIIEEFSEPGPIVVGPHAATTLTGERLTAISALPGRDARIPFAPSSKYIPSGSDLEVVPIKSIGGGVK